MTTTPEERLAKWEAATHDARLAEWHVMRARADAEARERALAKPPRVFAPWEWDRASHLFRFTLGDYQEGGTGGWMALLPPYDSLSVWLPLEAQQSPFVVFFDGEALPISRQSGDRYVSRFPIGGKWTVRVCADRRNGDIYVALPTAPEALEYITFVRWQDWPEWVEESRAAGYEVKVVSDEEWRSQGTSVEELMRFHEIAVFEDPLTRTRYLRRAKR